MRERRKYRPYEQLPFQDGDQGILWWIDQLLLMIPKTPRRIG